MKTTIASVLLLVAIGISAQAQAKDVTFPAVPGSMEELVALRNKIAVTPEGGAAAFLLAMIMYGEDRELGLQAFTLTLDMGELVNGTVYKGYKPRSNWYESFRQIDKFPFLGKIYVKGTKTDQGYALPAGSNAFTFTEIRNDRKGMMKVFVATTSGNWPRPMLMVKNDKGLWKVKEASSVFVGPSAMPPLPEEERKSDEL